MAFPFELIAQASSSVTLVIGFVALYFTIRAAIGLLSGEFKNLINLSSISIIFIIVGVSAMAFHHFTGNEPVEIIWYISISLSLSFSLFESYKLIQFGKIFKKIKARKKK